MALDLADLVAPEHTVVVTMECQNGVVGALSPMRELADATEPMLKVAGELAAAARDAGVTVIHCLALRRPDGNASSTNSRMLRAAVKSGMALYPGSKEAEVVPEIGVEEADIVLGRFHGLGPMGGTDLDMVCRNLGATTIVGVGMSLNVGMISFGLDAVNHGYQFVLPRDAVAGVPASYGEAMIENSYAMFSTVVEAEQIIDVWSSS